MERNIYKITFFLVTSIVLVGGSVYSQPALDGFLKGKSNLDVAVGGTYENFNQYYWKNDELIGLGRSSIAASAYGAMGITNWLDAQVNIPYISTSGSFSNLQDFSAYLKGAILDEYNDKGNNTRIMLAVGTSVPMTNYETEGLYAIGQQATSVDGRLVVQFTQASGFFVMFQGGYNNRSEPTPSSYNSAVKIGWAKAAHYIDIWFDSQYAIGGNDYFDYVSENVILGETDITFTSFGVSYSKLGFTYYKPIGETTGFALGASYVITGRNVGQAFGASASFVKRFSFAKE